MKKKLLMIGAVVLVLALIAGGIVFAMLPRNIDVAARMTNEVVRTEDGDLPFHMYVPQGDGPGLGWPVVIFLHGGGESGAGHFTPRQLNRNGGLSVLQLLFDEQNSVDHMAIVLLPRCPDGYRWADGEPNVGGRLFAMLEHARTHAAVDDARIYLVGNSRGGFGTVSLLAQHPDVFAAGVANAAGWSRYDDRALLPNLVHTPLWLFQTDEVSWSRDLAHEVEQLGGTVRYTEFSRSRRGTLERALAEPELLSWLFAQSR
ncbi:MAG: prolyl oligopeptidase family serine peptidase [Oscillospiraceae bacterium]|nr:prolyl oligopeptidase family serine peptidase [Oscillospiraceae bacterium]